MTAVRSSLQNAFETTLTAEMGPNDLFVDVATVSALTSPCYLSIEPDNDARREYVYFDGTFSSTRFVATGIGNRYLAGSAAASNITHPIGSIVRAVPMQQHIEDLHDRIDAIDHSDLSGLTVNDDHTQYVRVDGTRAFTDPVVSPDPTVSGHLANMNYVDTELAAAIAAISTDHGDLLGLGDDDHPHYLNVARGNALYSQLGHTHTYLPLTGGSVSGQVSFLSIVAPIIYLGANGRIYGENNDWLEITYDEKFEFYLNDTLFGRLDGTGLWLRGSKMVFGGADDWIESYEANNAMKFYIDNAEKARFDTSGSLSLGGDYIYFGIGGNDYLDFDDGNNYFRIVQDGAESHRFDKDGDLHINGNRIYMDIVGGDDYLYMANNSSFDVFLSGQNKFRLSSAGQITNTSPYGCDAWYSGGQSYPDASWTTMSLDNQRYNTGQLSLSTNKFTVPAPGLYIFGATARINGDPYHHKIMVQHSSGSSYEMEGEPYNGSFVECIGIRYCNTGETLYPRYYQDSTGNMSTYTNSQRFWVAKIA